MSTIIVSTTLTFIFLIPFTNAHPCSPKFKASVAHTFSITTTCWRQILGPEFAWNFNPNSRQLDIVFGSHLTSIAWLAWGLNPTGRHMVGTRALIGIKHPNGSLEYHTYNVTAYTKLYGCRLLPAENDFLFRQELGLHRFNFSYMEEIDYHIITATIILPETYNASATNMVWQIGTDSNEAEPLKHPTSLKHLSTAETVDFNSRNVVSESPHLMRLMRTVHGIVNIVGWGTLLPIGAIIARYFKDFPAKISVWFKLHIGFQIGGYILGTTGWGIGMWLGNTSKFYTFTAHRILAIIIFTFTTIQMIALVMKPKEDAGFRQYWNMYHHFLGYTLLVLTSINIFIGIGILEQIHAWKWAYIGVLGGLGVVVLGLEGYTWFKFFYSKYDKSPN